jgi:L-aspartate oxidase
LQAGSLQAGSLQAGSLQDGLVREELQHLMTRDAGVLRDAGSLTRASNALASMSARDPEVANLLAVSRALVASALAREESRGTHTRLDFPAADPTWLGRLVITGTTSVLMPLVPVSHAAPVPPR